MRRLSSIFCTLGVCCAAHASGAVEVGDTEVELSLRDGLITMHLEEPVPLRDLLEAIGEEGGIAMLVRGDLGLAQPRAIEERPLAEAIRDLAGEHSLLMMYRDGEAIGGPLSKVVVYAAAPSGERAEARARAIREAPQPPAGPAPLPSDTAATIRELDEAGFSPEEISEELEVPVEQVRRHLQSVGGG